MSQHAELRRCRRLAALALLVAGGTATSGLYDAVLPWPWLVALTAPALVLGRWRQQPRWWWLRVVAGSLLQFAACLLAHAYCGPIERPAALAGTILPPLAFVVARGQDADVTLGAFLSFCVLLVTVILGADDGWRTLVFATATAVLLRSQARLAALGAAPATTPPGRRQGAPWRSGLVIGLLCACLQTALARSFALLPAMTGSRAPAPSAANAAGARAMGLADEFAFPESGELLAQDHDRIVEVAGGDGEPVPGDLYLRSGFFDLAGLDGWRQSRIRPLERDTRVEAWRWRAPAQRPERRVTVHRLAAARTFVFTTPETTAIAGLEQLLGDAEREWFRSRAAAVDDRYQLWLTAARRPRSDPAGAASPADQQQLTALPAGLERERLQQLLDEWQPGTEPLAAARTIAAALQDRCHYQRREPEGPHGQPLMNFLFGDRTGFCMHFAAAAATLLRLHGVPCRIGVGLHRGDDQGGVRVFGSRHAHAWVEIPLRGHGFAVIDPTPPGERGVDGGAALRPPPADVAAPPAALPATLATLRSLWDSTAPAPWLLLPLLLLLWRRQQRHAPAPSAPGSGRGRRARRWLRAIDRALAEHGHGRPVGVTLEQHQLQLQRRGLLAAELRAAFTAYQEVRFGGRAWDLDRQQCMAAGLAAARGLLRAAPA